MKFVVLAVVFVILGSAIWWVPEVLLRPCVDLPPNLTLNDCQEGKDGLTVVLRWFFGIGAVVVGTILVGRIRRVSLESKARSSTGT